MVAEITVRVDAPVVRPSPPHKKLQLPACPEHTSAQPSLPNLTDLTQSDKGTELPQTNKKLQISTG